MSLNFNKYPNNQVILTSDRLIFNSKVDDIFLLSKTTIGLIAGHSVHINIGDQDNPNDENSLIVNSPKIQLGISSKGTLEPICKGDSTKSIIDDMIDSVNNFCISLQTAKGLGSGVVTLPDINKAANKLMKDLSNIKKKTNNIKSDTTYSI